MLDEKVLNDLTYRDYYYRLKLLAKGVFKWNNLPNGINEKWIEKYLFDEGRCIFFKDDKLGFMVTKCADSNKLNFYDEPTELKPVATNYRSSAKSYENNKECVLIQNNDDEIATNSTIQLFAHRLAEITRTIDINCDAQKTPILILTTNKQKQTLKQIYQKIQGNEPVIFADKDLDLNGVKVLRTDAPIVFDKLQLQKHAIWNECMTFLGINNANMDKKERLVDDEVQANDEQIELCADIMLKSRQRACEQINKIFGLNISVEFRQAEKGCIKLTEGGE